MIALGIATLVTVASLAVYAIVATRRAADVPVLEERLRIALANLANETERADLQTKRADALDSLLADHIAAGPVAGSWELLQAKWRAAHSATAADAPVPDSSAGRKPAKEPGPDDLLRPGD